MQQHCHKFMTECSDNQFYENQFAVDKSLRKTIYNKSNVVIRFEYFLKNR